MYGLFEKEIPQNTKNPQVKDPFIFEGCLQPCFFGFARTIQLSEKLKQTKTRLSKVLA